MSALIAKSVSVSKAETPLSPPETDAGPPKGEHPYQYSESPDLAWHSEQLIQAQVQLLLEGSRLAALLTLLAGPLLAFLLRASVPGRSLLLWTGMITAISVFRLVLLTRYRNHGDLGQHKLRGLQSSLLWWNGVSGLAWGSTAILAFPPDSLPQQTLLLLILAGVITTAVTVHSGMLGAVLAFTLPATLPMIVRLVNVHDSAHERLALLAVFFLLITMAIAYKMHRLTLRGILVGVDNANLVEHLKQTKRQTDKLNTELRREITVRRYTEDTIRSLLTISEHLNASLDLTHLMESLVKETLQLVRGESAYAGLLDDGKLVTTPYFSQGVPLRLDASPAHLGDTLPGYVVSTQRCYLCNDAANDPKIADSFKATGDLHSVLCVPIIDIDGETLGFIEVHNKRDSGEFSERDCRKLESAANSAALAIQNAKSYQAVKDAEALLSDESAILEAIAKRLLPTRVLQTIVNVAETRCEGLVACFVQYDRWQDQRHVICSPSVHKYTGKLQSLHTHLKSLIRHEDIKNFDLFEHPGLLAPGGLLREARDPGYRHAYLCPIGDSINEEQGILLLLSVSDVMTHPKTLSVLEKIRHLAGIALERWSTEQGLQIRDQAISTSMNAILLINNRDAGFPIMYANEAAGKLTGTLARRLTGQSLTALLTGVTSEHLKTIESALRDRHKAYTTISLPQRDGASRVIEMYVTPVRGMNGETGHSIAIMNDVSERVLAQRALEESEARLIAMTANIPGMVYQYIDDDASTSYVYVSRGAREVVGIEAQDILDGSTRLTDLILPDDLAGFEQSRTQARRSLTTWIWEGRMISPENGTLRWIDVRSSPRRQANGTVLWDGIIFDVTIRKQAEFDLAQSRELLRSLSSHLQNVREEEKASLARELHDELGSMLTTLKIEVCSLMKQIPPDRHDMHASVDAIVDTVHEAIATTRRISTSLRPPILDSLGLLPAIEWQLEQFKQRTGKAVDLHVTGESSKLSNDHTIAVFRILQEGLTNIARHAQATRVSVAVVLDEGMIALDIIDDGIGFSASDQKPGESYGLYSLQERARALGGTAEIISQPGEGARLKVRVPVTPPGECKDRE